MIFLVVYLTLWLFSYLLYDVLLVECGPLDFYCVLIFFLTSFGWAEFFISRWWLLMLVLAKYFPSLASCCILWTKEFKKKTQDTYLILYHGIPFYSPKGEGHDDMPRLHVSKTGAVLIVQGHSGCHVIYVLLIKGQLRSTDLPIIFSSSLGIHRLCYTMTDCTSFYNGKLGETNKDQDILFVECDFFSKLYVQISSYVCWLRLMFLPRHSVQKQKTFQLK